MTDRELMQQALDVINSECGFGGSNDYDPKAIAAALRDRLAQPEREPVAWANEIIENLHALYDSKMIKENDSGDALIRLDAAIAAVEEAEESHKAPPQRKPLTQDLYNELLFAVGNKYPNETRHQTALRYILQAEKGDAKAAHGIKENK